MSASLLVLAELCLGLGCVNRATLHPDGRRAETDTTHTVMVAVLACAVAAEHPELHLDLGRVAQLGIIHDLVEVYAGDTDTFLLAAQGLRDGKAEREAVALRRIEADCAAWPWLARTIKLYEAQLCAEARFVRFLDKVCPRLTNTLNGGAAIRARGMGRAESFAHDRALAADLNARYPEFAAVCGELFRQACEESERAWTEPAAVLCTCDVRDNPWACKGADTTSFRHRACRCACHPVPV